MVELSTQYAEGFLPGAEEEAELLSAVKAAAQTLTDGSGKGADFLGWQTLGGDINHAYNAGRHGEYQRMKAAALRIQEQSDVLLVIGIGGSYLGARAVIEGLQGRYRNELTNGLRVYFTGNSLSAADLADITALTEGKRFSINVISKSGTTLECAAAFRYFRDLLSRRYPDNPEEVKARIYATTDAARGALKAQADAQGWETFVVPDDVGGRYSVLTAVGLLPILAACGAEASDSLLAGAAAAEAAYAEDAQSLSANACWHYAALRAYFYLKAGYKAEILSSYEPSFVMFTEWWKQLFGESEGKDGKGLFPAGVNFTTDLHSMGQYIQEGERLFFETVLQFEAADNPLAIPSADSDGDKLNYIAGKAFHEINRTAFTATAIAHQGGKVPNLVLTVPKRDAESLGWLIAFFEKACALSGYLIGVNPFDQPGVESYKRYMFTLLGNKDPKYDPVREELITRYGIVL